ASRPLGKRLERPSRTTSAMHSSGLHPCQVNAGLRFVRAVVADPQLAVVPGHSGVTRVAAAGQSHHRLQLPRGNVEPAQDRLRLALLDEPAAGPPGAVRQLDEVRSAEVYAQVLPLPFGVGRLALAEHGAVGTAVAALEAIEVIAAESEGRLGAVDRLELGHA